MLLRAPRSWLRLPPRPPSVCRISSSIGPAAAVCAPPSSAYVHLPFCRKRCHYCDFPIVALGSSSSSSTTTTINQIDPRISDYVAVVIREILATTTTIAGDLRRPLETIYFGGGTPSLVPPILISQILETLDSKIGIAAGAEISIEMDPGTFDALRLGEIVDLGVNRVSVGVQAFQEELLKACGRAHGVREAMEAVEIIGGCSRLSNWSMDLISSLPRQSPEMWKESLKLAVDAGTTHLSIYDLQVEPGTKFSQLYMPGESPLPSEAQSAKLYEMASETIRAAGFNHYEISSYCKPGFECKHNLTYWSNLPFYGFGLGAASYLYGARISRPKKLRSYVDFVDRLEMDPIGGGSSSSSPAAASGDAAAAMDTVMLSLRTARGLDLGAIAAAFGESMAVNLCGALMPYARSGHVIAMDASGRALPFDAGLEPSIVGDRGLAFLRLSDPHGFLLSNELIAVAFAAISS